MKESVIIKVEIILLIKAALKRWEIIQKFVFF